MWTPASIIWQDWSSSSQSKKHFRLSGWNGYWNIQHQQPKNDPRSGGAWKWANTDEKSGTDGVVATLQRRKHFSSFLFFPSLFFFLHLHPLFTPTPQRLSSQNTTSSMSPSVSDPPIHTPPSTFRTNKRPNNNMQQSEQQCKRTPWITCAGWRNIGVTGFWTGQKKNRSEQQGLFVLCGSVPRTLTSATSKGTKNNSSNPKQESLFLVLSSFLSSLLFSLSFDS